MSLLPYATNQNPFKSYFLTTDQLSSINGYTNSTVKNWSLAPAVSDVNLQNYNLLSTNSITLDQVTLTAAENELFINGVPIITSTALINVGDWSYYDAVSTINLNNQDVINGKNLSATNVSATMNISAMNITGSNAIMSPTIMGTTITGTTANVSAVNTNILSTSLVKSPSISSINIACSNLSATNINGSSNFNTANWSQFPAVSNIAMNGHNIVANSDLVISAPLGTLINSGAGATIQSGQTQLLSDRGAAVALNSQLNLTAQNGYRGIVNITAEPGYAGLNGQVNITANGGTLSGIGYGGLINMTATTPVGLSNLTSAIRQSAGSMESYAGITTPITSVFGYNFIAGNLGVEICAGLPPSIPNVPGTVYLYATTGITFGADAYMGNIFPYWNGVGAGNDLKIAGRVIGIQQVHTQLSNCSHIYMDGDAAITGCLNLQANAANISSLTVSTINGSKPILNYISTFSDLHTSTLSVSSITGVNYLTQYISTFPNITTPIINSPTSLQVTSFNDMNIVSQTGQQVFLAGQYVFGGGDVKANTASISTIYQSTNSIVQHGYRQPFIQYGTFGATGNSGSSTITLSIAYPNTSYTSIASMNDTVPAQMSCFNSSRSTIQIHWANAGGGSQQICWTTMGDI